MNYKSLLHVISLILLIVTSFLSLPILVAILYKETSLLPSLLMCFFGSLVFFLTIYFLTKSSQRIRLSIRDGFLLVSLSWILSSITGAMPYYVSGAIPSFTDAFFETMSGFTTTGASILTDIEALPRALLFWRSLTHWLGGMGIVVLIVAILPMLGIGGLHLIQAESPGPRVDKLVPKVTSTAKILWLSYVLLTVFQTILLLFGGMDFFDSLTHTFGTLATGGFSPRAASVGYYNSAYIDTVITIFMILAGINFALYYSLFRGHIKPFFQNTEFKVYLSIFFVAMILISLNLHGRVYQSLAEAFRYGSFQAASIITTTGYATADFDTWPHFSKALLFFLMFVGGSSGSTGGGIKVIRLVLLFKLAINEMKKLMFPKNIHKFKVNKESVNKHMVYTIGGFVFLYLCLLLFITLCVAATEQDLVTSFSTALVTLGNIGPGFNLVGPTMNYQFYNDAIKWLLSFAMLVGRLEIYTVIVLFLPSFWKR